METEEKVELTVRTRVFVYLTQAFTTLGARMWWFGIGLFLIEVAPDSLQLTAIYGFTSGGAMLLMAAVVGDWIDKSTRLRAARVAMISNNLSVISCCIIVFLVLTYKPEIEAQMENKGLLQICFAIIVINTIITNLCNLGRTLIMERDWIVEICGRHKDTIATMSATFRAIDLLTKIVAPLITGQVMTYASPRIGAICIAAWNVISTFIEYFLIWKVYSIFPALQRDKKGIPEIDEMNKAVTLVYDKDVEKQNEDELKKQDSEKEESAPNPSQSLKDENIGAPGTGNKKSHGLLYNVFFSLISLVRGWRYYMKYDVAIAGIALACLYFTVLGFDNITIAYAFTQGMNESILGILFGMSACFGLIASIAYPFIRKKVGLVKAGLLGLTCQVSCLSLCLISLGLPGSKFDPNFLNRPKLTHGSIQICNGSFTGSTAAPLSEEIIFRNSSWNSQNNSSQVVAVINSALDCYNSTEIPDTREESKVSLIVLFTGILGARFANIRVLVWFIPFLLGVWTADLVIAQLFLENVMETERGIVNGFQSSLNKLMDMLKFIMVIFIPDPEMFGYPAMVSFCFICTAWILYARYTKKTMGYLCCK